MQKLDRNRNMQYYRIEKDKGQLFGWKDIKLSFLCKSYDIDRNNGESKCTLVCKVSMHGFKRHFNPSKYLMRRICEGYLHNMNNGQFTVTASVKVSGDDIFDETTGRILSEAKAKEKAYIRVYNIERRMAKMFREAAGEIGVLSADMHKHASNERKRYRMFGKTDNRVVLDNQDYNNNMENYSL